MFGEKILYMLLLGLIFIGFHATIPDMIEILAKNHSDRTGLDATVKRFLIARHVGDLGMARTIETEWHRGGMTKPLMPRFFKGIPKEIRTCLDLPSNYSGKVEFFINGGMVIKIRIS